MKQANYADVLYRNPTNQKLTLNFYKIKAIVYQLVFGKIYIKKIKLDTVKSKRKVKGILKKTKISNSAW